MNLIQTLVLSIVEGITEFLPISSTGHLILASNLLRIPQTEFLKSFEIIIQLGAILAIVVIYFSKLWNNFRLWKNVLIAFLPSAIIGLFFYRYIKLYLIGNSTVVIWSLLIGGIVMLLFEKFFKPNIRYTIYNIPTIQLIAVGLMQIFSMIPGVSRAFATIFGGMVVGMNRKEATEFSFFLAIPTMFGASVLDLYKTGFVYHSTDYILLTTGFIGSFVTAYIVVKWLIKFVQNHNFNVFGWYRIALALIFYIFSNIIRTMTDRYTISANFDEITTEVLVAAVKRSNLPENVNIIRWNEVENAKKPFVVVVNAPNVKDARKAFKRGALGYEALTYDADAMTKSLNIK